MNIIRSRPFNVTKYLGYDKSRKKNSSIKGKKTMRSKKLKVKKLKDKKLKGKKTMKKSKKQKSENKSIIEILKKVNKSNFKQIPKGLTKENFANYLKIDGLCESKKTLKSMWDDYTRLVYVKYPNYIDELREQQKSKVGKLKKSKSKVRKLKKSNSKMKLKGGSNPAPVQDEIIDDNNFYCDVPNDGINVTKLTDQRIYGMARPNGADIMSSIAEEHFCFYLNDCRIKLNSTLTKIYNKNIRGYVNLEDFDDYGKDYFTYGNYGDLEKIQWESMADTKYLNLSTKDMHAIEEDDLSAISNLYDENPDMSIIFHCLCGKGRTGNAILSLVLNNGLGLGEYDPHVVFPYVNYRMYIRNNFHIKTATELFRVNPMENYYIDPFHLNLFLERINKINTFIGKKRAKPFYLYTMFDIGNVNHQWININNWLENKKKSTLFCLRCNEYKSSFIEINENNFICTECDAINNGSGSSFEIIGPNDLNNSGSKVGSSFELI